MGGWRTEAEKEITFTDWKINEREKK